MAVVVLAAGFSGRMGMLKAALAFDDKTTFAEKIAQTFLDAGVGKVVFVLNSKGMNLLKKSSFLSKEKKVTFVLNPFPEKERFFSVKTGMKKLTGFQAVFLHNVDNPFVCKTTISKLTNCLQPDSFVIPRYAGRGGHPILLSQKIVRDLAFSREETINLRVFLSKYSPVFCPVHDEQIRVNINTAEEYARYFGRFPRL